MCNLEILASLLALVILEVGSVSQYFDMTKDTCVMSLVIPKESIKSTCGSSEGLLAKMQAMETRMNQLRRRVHVIDVQRLQPTMLQYGSLDTKVKTMENTLQSTLLKNRFYEEKLKHMESKIISLSKSLEKSKDSPDRLLDPIKPLLMAEFDSMKANLLKSLEQEIFQRYLQNFEEIGSSDEQTADITVGVDHNSSSETKKLSLESKSNSQLNQEELLTVDPGNLDHLARSLKSVPGRPKTAFQSINEQSTSSPIVTTETNNDTDLKNETGYFSNLTNRKLNETNGEGITIETNTTIMQEIITDSFPLQNISSKLISMVNNAVAIATKQFQEELDKIKDMISTIHSNLLQNNTARIWNLESNFTWYKQNLTKIVQHLIDSQASSEFLTSGNFQEVRSAIDRLERRLDSPQNDLLRESKFKEELKRLKANIQSELSSRLDNSVSSLQRGIEVLDRKVNVSSSFITLFKQTLQSYRNESRTAIGNLEIKMNQIRSQVQEMNLSKDQDGSDLEMRVEDIERELSDVIMTQSFADDKIDGIKAGQIEKDREIGTKFREVTNSINRVNSKLSVITGLNRTLQVLEVKNSMMSNTVKKVENTIKYLYIQQKLESNQWLAYNFSYTSVKNGCNKMQYVKKNTHCTEDVGKFVGVVLCSADRYKIFLGNSLDDTFLDIGDENGRGEDHCEFVGGSSEEEAEVEKSFHFFTSTKAYIRSIWGRPPVLGMISSILIPTTSWYECGVKIP